MSNPKRLFLALLSLLMGMGLGVVLLLSTAPKKPRYVSPYTPGATPPPVAEPGNQPFVPALPSDGKKPQKGYPVTFYVLADTPDGPALRPETRFLTGTPPTDQARIAEAITAMTEGEHPVLPAKTRLLRLKIEGSNVVLDLSKELKENFSGGDKAEQLAVNALTATVGQLPGIETVQVFVEGEAIETLGGSQALLEPLKVPKLP